VQRTASILLNRFLGSLLTDQCFLTRILVRIEHRIDIGSVLVENEMNGRPTVGPLLALLAQRPSSSHK